MWTPDPPPPSGVSILEKLWGGRPREDQVKAADARVFGASRPGRQALSSNLINFELKADSAFLHGRYWSALFPWLSFSF